MTAHPTSPTRRSVISTGAAAALGVGVLSACSSEEVGAAAGSVAAGAADAAKSAAASAAGAAVAQLTDIPVGGAVVKEVGGQKVVLAQPEAGKVVAFSAICTHQGCTVAADGAQLKCPCHGSVFSSATGAVENGPATKNLPSVSVNVSADGITLA